MKCSALGIWGKCRGSRLSGLGRVKERFSRLGRQVAIRKDSPEFSTSWWELKPALYGSTTVSEIFGEGITEKVSMMRSGYLRYNVTLVMAPLNITLLNLNQGGSFTPVREALMPSQRLLTHLTSRPRSCRVVWY